MKRGTYDQGYTKGRRDAGRALLHTAFELLGQDEARAAAWARERADAISVLRRVCEQHGDNDWPDSLNLADIIEKHLERHLP